MPPPHALLNGVRLLLVNDLALSLRFPVCCVMKVGLSVANQVGSVEQASTLNLRMSLQASLFSLLAYIFHHAHLFTLSLPLLTCLGLLSTSAERDGDDEQRDEHTQHS